MRFCDGVALITLLGTASAACAQTCPGVISVMPAHQQHSYLEQISRRSLGHPAVAQIRIDRYMRDGKWSAIVSTPPGNERGVFFFRDVHGRPVLKDVWGGVAGPDNAQTLAGEESKALGPGFPAALALCFAHAVGASD